MTKLTINNSMCSIIGLPKEAEKRLRHELSYPSQAVSYSYHKNLRQIEYINQRLDDKKLNVDRNALISERTRLERINHSLKRKLFVMLYKDGEFPTGLLPRVLEVLNDCQIQHEVDDQRRKPIKLQHKFVLKKSFPNMRYYQRTSARLAAEAGRGIIVAATGTGKTLTMLKMIWEMGLKCLIITPNKGITDNAVDSLIEYFGKSAVTRLNTKSKKTGIINVANIQALIKIDPKVLEDINAVYIDEFHHSAAETYQEVNQKHLKNCYYRIGLTATNFRNDGSDLALEGVLSEVLYEYTIPQAIKDGFLVAPDFEMVNTSCDAENNYQTEYKKGIVENEERNAIIAEIAKHHEKDSVLILVQQVEHGESLKKLMPDAAFLHGEEKDDVRKRVMEDFRKKRIRSIIGTSVIGEGIDLPIANVLIMGGGGKAKSQIMQNIGRVMRLFPGKDWAKVYDFTDEDSHHLSRHSEIRQQIYQEEYVVEISKEEEE